MASKRRNKGGRTTPKGTRPDSGPSRPADSRSGATDQQPSPRPGRAAQPGRPSQPKGGPHGGNRDVPPRKPA